MNVWALVAITAICGASCVGLAWAAAWCSRVSAESDPHGLEFPEYTRFWFVDSHEDSTPIELEFGMAIGDEGELDVYLHAKPDAGKGGE